MVTRDPRSLILPLKDAGIRRFTFQFEIAGDKLITESKLKMMEEDNEKMKGMKKNKNVQFSLDSEVEVKVEVEIVNEKSVADSTELKKIEVERREGVIATALAIRQAGMLCGVCIAPHTDVKELKILLETWYQPHTGITVHWKCTF